MAGTMTKPPPTPSKPPASPVTRPMARRRATRPFTTPPSRLSLGASQGLNWTTDPVKGGADGHRHRDIAQQARVHPGKRRPGPARTRVQNDPEVAAASSRSRLRDPDCCDQRPPDTRAAQPRVALRPRTARGYRLSLDPSGRPGHRAFGRRVLFGEPGVLRRRE